MRLFSQFKVHDPGTYIVSVFLQTPFSDSDSENNLISIEFQIPQENQAPTAYESSFQSEEDEFLTATLLGTDPESQQLTFILVDPPANGQATLLDPALGTVQYLPQTNFHGSDSFSFKVSDGALESPPALVQLTINPVNDSPIAQNGSGETDEDTPFTGAVEAEDVDGDAQALIVTVPPTHGTLQTQGLSFIYTPHQDYAGGDFFQFKVSDGQAESNEAVFSLTIRPINDAPLAQSTTLVLDEDTVATTTLQGTDPESQQLTFILVDPPANGQATLLDPALGTVQYLPQTNFHGSDSFSFKVSDGALESPPALVQLTINPVNDAPIAQNGSGETDEDTPFTGAVEAEDVDGDALALSVTVPPTHGTLQTQGLSFIYTPHQDYAGGDFFQFKVSDGQAESNEAVFSLTIRPINDPPLAHPGTLTLLEDTPTSGFLSGIDPEGDSLTFVLVAPPSKGAVQITNPVAGSFIFTPDHNAYGEDHFSLRVHDGSLYSQPATFAVFIQGVDDPPVAFPDTWNIEEDQTITGFLPGHDPDGDPLTYHITSQPRKGSLILANPAAGIVHYSPRENFNGTDSFKFQVSDGPSYSPRAKITLNIAAVNDPPDIVLFSIPSQVKVNRRARLTASARDVDGDTLTYLWDFGDQTPLATGRTQFHRYALPGQYEAVLTVRDSGGGEARRSGLIEVQPAARGDVNGDGTVSLGDLYSLQEFLNKGTPLAGDGDCNANGQIDWEDVFCLISTLLNMEVEP